ncbi:MAG: response regulator [Lysobacterales bacterium 14-68-21]|jgi:twitching motility two-component system response regulator PilH|nr:MAG: response regulator [Xanthomonadales bacterium 15-68-25]OZB66673.1 MAG: response regulator [Xanthomonadales bacterium 14-68-21]
MSGFDLFKRLLGTERRQHMPRTQAVRGTRMLVVDDSPTIRAVLGKMLTQDGYVVSKAGDGETALRLAREEKPELIFLDIVMPGMNGFAVLRALRREPDTHGIPIVMISGNLQATEQFYVQRFGADDFMKKPFGRAEVFGRIQHLVEAGRLPARDPVLDPPQDLPAESAMDSHIPDVALPDADDPHMVTPAFTGALDPHADEPTEPAPADAVPPRD